MGGLNIRDREVRNQEYVEGSAIIHLACEILQQNPESTIEFMNIMIILFSAMSVNFT